MMGVYLQYAAHVNIALNGRLAFLFCSCGNKTKPSEKLMSISTWRDTWRVWDKEKRKY